MGMDTQTGEFLGERADIGEGLAVTQKSIQINPSSADISRPHSLQNPKFTGCATLGVFDPASQWPTQKSIVVVCLQK